MPSSVNMDQLTAVLDAIRVLRANSEIGGLYRPTVAQLDLSAEDVPRLLAAVDGVLREHQPRTPEPPPGRNYVICVACSRIWPCQSVLRISAAVLDTHPRTGLPKEDPHA